MSKKDGMILVCTRFVRKTDGTIIRPKNGDKICFWVTEEENRQYWEKKAKQKQKATTQKKKTDKNKEE